VSWESLFDRASGSEVTAAQIRDRLADRRGDAWKGTEGGDDNEEDEE
jgi:hypothetical protein